MDPLFTDPPAHLADGTPTPTPFDLNKLFEGVAEAVTKKNSATQALIDTTQAESDRVAQSADALNQRAQGSLQDLNRIQSAEADSTRLATSNNLWDRFTLLGNQILDPNNYTSDGRQKRRSEIQSDLSLAENIHSVTALDAAANVNRAQAGVDAANAQQDMVTAGLKAQIDATNLARTNLEANQALKEAALIPVSKSDLQTALSSPVDPNTGTINVAGLQYRPDEIRNRINDLTMREQLSLLPPEATNPAYKAAMNTWQRMNLQTHSVEEINRIRVNNGVDPVTGTVYDPQVLSDVSQQKMEAYAADASRRSAEFTVNNFQGSYATQEQQFIDKLNKTVPADSPLRAGLTTYQSQLAWAVKAMNEATTPEAKAVAVDQAIKAKTQFNAAADKEATRLAGSDKDLKDLMYEQLTTGEMSPDGMQAVITKRLANNQPLGRLINESDLPRLRKFFDDAYNGLKAKNGGFNLDPNASPKESDKNMREEAAQQAFVQFQASMGNDVMNQTLDSIPMIQGSPLNNNVSVAEWRTVMDHANSTAWDLAKKQFGLTDDQVKDIQAGKSVQGKNVNDIKNFKQQSVNDNIWLGLESIRSGLGSAYADWLVNNANPLAEHFTSQLPTNYQPLLAGDIRDKVAALGNNMITSRNNQDMVASQRVSRFLTGRDDPKFMNALLLQSDSTLSQEQRQMIFDKIVSPVLDESQKAGWSDQTTLDNIEKVMTQAKPDDKVLANALKKHLSQRFAIQSNIDSWIQAFTNRNTTPEQRNWLGAGIRSLFDMRPLVHPFSNNWEPNGRDTIKDMGQTDLGWAYRGNSMAGRASNVGK